LYTQLISVVMNSEFPTEVVQLETRMTKDHPEQMLSVTRICSEQRVVCVNLARAGTVPSHICYQSLHSLIVPQQIRQDHMFAARKTNSADQVTHSDFAGIKIGGDIEDAIVLLPD